MIVRSSSAQSGQIFMWNRMHNRNRALFCTFFFFSLNRRLSALSSDLRRRLFPERVQTMLRSEEWRTRWVHEILVQFDVLDFTIYDLRHYAIVQRSDKKWADMLNMCHGKGWRTFRQNFKNFCLRISCDNLNSNVKLSELQLFFSQNKFSPLIDLPDREIAIRLL